MKRLKQKASYMSGWGMLCLYLPGPTSAGCIHFEHPCYNSWSQNYSCMVLPRCLSSHFLPELVGEFSGNIHEGSLQAASTVHKRGCCDWPLSINIDQSLHSEPTTFLLLLHSCKTNAMTRLLRKESRKRKQFIHKEPRSFHTFHKFSHALTTGRLSTRKT